jgi:hypothetical protein
MTSEPVVLFAAQFSIIGQKQQNRIGERHPDE